MGIDVNKLESRWQKVKTGYTARDAVFKKLDSYYRGNLFQEELENETYRYVTNKLADTIDDYAVLEAQVPEIQVPPPQENEEGRNFADRVEKILYEIWQKNYPASLMEGISRYKNLFGGAPLNVHPQGNRIVRYTLGEPGNFHPVLSANDENIFNEVYFTKEMTREDVRKYYGNKLEGNDLEKIKVLLYWDKDNFLVMYNRKILYRIEHKLGFVPWVVIKQNAFPNELFGFSTVRFSVALNKYINELMSDYAEIVHYNAGPIVIGEGTGKTAETWLTGPNAFNEIKKGGRVSILESSNPPLNLESQLNRVERDYDIDSGIAGGILHGKVEHTIGSGRVVSGLTMGTEIRIVRRQALMAEGLQLANRYALELIEKEKLTAGSWIRGAQRGKTFVFQFNPADLHGYYENLIQWPIGLWDYPSKVVTVLQLIGSKLMSKYTGMEILGTRSPVDEQKRIEEETMAELKMQQEMQQAMTMPPEGGEEKGFPKEKVEKELGGELPVEEPGKELGLEEKEALRAEKGATERKKPQGRPKGGRPAPASTERLVLNEVSRALANIPKLKGDIYLYGGLITEGYTDRDIDLMLTDMRDKATVIHALPQWRGRFSFKQIEKGEKAKGSQLHVVAKPEIR